MRDHLLITKDINFDIRKTEPVPLMVALEREALVNGLHPEGLQIAVDCNIGWLEHHGTKITHKSPVGHEISPNQPAFVGGDPS